MIIWVLNNLVVWQKKVHCIRTAIPLSRNEYINFFLFFLNDDPAFFLMLTRTQRQPRIGQCGRVCARGPGEGGERREGGGIQEMSSRTSEIRSNTQREESPHVTATQRLYLAKGSSEHQDRSGVPSPHRSVWAARKTQTHFTGSRFTLSNKQHMCFCWKPSGRAWERKRR